MREILFRGKRLGGGHEWVYGNYNHIDRKSAFFTAFIGADKLYPVIPESVGQYTGLKDMHGERIFEGDILSAHLDEIFPDEETRGCVCWHDYGWHIKIGAHFDTLESDWVSRFFEIIGNIYDNPELLEGEAAFLCELDKGE